MHIENQNYRGKPTDILYADEGYLLQHKETKLCYGSVSLEEGRKQSDYDEIEAPKEEEDDNDIVA